MKKVFLFFILTFFVYYVQAQKFSMEYGGLTRTYILHLPPTYNPSNNHPLVMSFHGLNMTGSSLQSRIGMDAVADANNFIVVYPDGVNNSWNAGINNSNVDDVGFVNALIDKLMNDYAINPNKVYATGYSMGGYFSYRLACRLSNKIAAIAPVSGHMADINNCNATRSMPVMHMHGTSDWLVSYNQVSSIINYWRNFNNCTANPQTIELPNNVDLFVYGGCDDNTEVRLYRLNGRSHSWPSTSSTIYASQEIWNFLSRFSLSDDQPGNPAPQVAISSPANNASFNAPATIEILATATDANGSVVKVEFFQGASKLGEDLTSPYTYTWTNVPEGEYSITAKATDNEGASTTSAAVPITVVPVGGVCATTPPYSSDDTYEAGSLVKNGDRIYECKSASRCNGASWAYAPGSGFYWRYAWNYIEDCSATGVQQLDELVVEESLLRMYPNPARDKITLEFISTVSSEASISVTNIHAKCLIQESVNTVPGENKHDVNLDKLPGGLYLLHLTIGNERISKTIYITK